MAKRRRRSSLGSPPAVHRTEARDGARAARFWLREYRREVAKGDCRQALHSLLTANRMTTKTAEHRRGTGRHAKYPVGLLNAAEKRFARACIVGGSALRGLFDKPRNRTKRSH